MTRLPLIALCALLSASALAQQHKISVQKFEVPAYPPIARQARISGDVKLSFDVPPSGEPQHIVIISGHPLLSNHTVQMITSWRFHCDHCKIGESTAHKFTYTFAIADATTCEGGPTEVNYSFPDSLIIKASPAIICDPVSIVSKTHGFWWRLFRPKYW